MYEAPDTRRWIPIQYVIEVLERRGYAIIDNEGAHVLRGPRDPDHSVVFPASVSELPEFAIRNVLRDEPLDLDIIIAEADSLPGASPDKS